MILKTSLVSLFRWPRPLTAADAAEIAYWVNEGGSFDPAGPPLVIEEQSTPVAERQLTGVTGLPAG